MGPKASRGILGNLLGSYRVYSRNIRIPGLRAHTMGLWVSTSDVD